MKDPFLTLQDSVLCLPQAALARPGLVHKPEDVSRGDPAPRHHGGPAHSLHP